MPIYQRWRNDSSGSGGQFESYSWPDSGDNDSFFILKPIVWLISIPIKIISVVFKIPAARNILFIIVGIILAAVGAVVAVGLGIAAIVICAVGAIGLFILLAMLYVWSIIIKTMANDSVNIYHWLRNDRIEYVN